MALQELYCQLIMFIRSSPPGPCSKLLLLPTKSIRITSNPSVRGVIRRRASKMVSGLAGNRKPAMTRRWLRMVDTAGDDLN